MNPTPIRKSKNSLSSQDSENIAEKQQQYYKIQQNRMSAVRKMSYVHKNMYRKSGPIKSQQHTYQKKISMMTPRDNMLILLGKSHRAHHCLEIFRKLFVDNRGRLSILLGQAL